MRIKKYAGMVTILLVMALAASVATRADEPHSGTWKMNPAKSKFSPGPANKDMTLKIDEEESSIKVVGDGTDGEGKSIYVEYNAKLDGTDTPATVPYGDTIALKRINAHTIQSVAKKDGKVVMTVTSTVSADGKTRTSKFKGKDAKGNAVNNTVVYDKQ